MKNHTYYFFDIIIKHFDPNNFKIDEKSYKNILTYDIGYLPINIQHKVQINSVNPLYLIFSKVNEYFEEINKSKFLVLFPTNGSNEKIKNMKIYGVKSKI